jgi:type II secretory pathway pseudopilin PulG
MAFQSQTRRCSGRSRSQHNEHGYILLTLLLVIALMTIFAAAIVPSIKFDLKRDREEEMIHRGVQYSRAIRAYYKKFGRYPTKIEDLESANNLRFLRKRYKDPITGKDFKLLHYGEARLSMGGGIGGGMIPGANPIGANGLNGPNGVGGVAQPSSLGGANGGFGANSNSSFGQNQNQQNQNQQTPGGQAPEPDLTQATGQPSPDGTGANPPGPGNGNGIAASGDKLSGQVFGGGAILGVASTSKDPTIREFDHKKKYSEWQFVYDPATDRGGIITTPYQPQVMGFGLQGGQGLQGLNPQNINGQTGNGQTGPGNGLGTSPYGTQNNPNQPSPGGFGNSNQPPNNPPQPPQQQ